jgi:hypothetical protein
MVLIVVLSAAGAAVADSVMVSVRADAEYPEQSRLGFYLSSVESGIMDVLFERGHIVFNRAQQDSVANTSQVVEMADDGGAGFVVDAVVSFGYTADALVFDRIDYSWMEIGSGRAPETATIGVDAVDNGEGGKTERVGYALGRRIGALFAGAINSVPEVRAP